MPQEFTAVSNSSLKASCGGGADGVGGFPKSLQGSQPVCEALVYLPDCSRLLPTISQSSVPLPVLVWECSRSLGEFHNTFISHRTFRCQCWILLVSTLTHPFSPAPNHVYFFKFSSPLIPFFLILHECCRLFSLLSMTVSFSGIWEGRALNTSAQIALWKSHWSLCLWFSLAGLLRCAPNIKLSLSKWIFSFLWLTRGANIIAVVLNPGWLHIRITWGALTKCWCPNCTPRGMIWLAWGGA